MRTLLKNLINDPAARQAVRQFEKWIYCHSERSEESDSIRELQKEILRLTPQNDNCRTACKTTGYQKDKSLFCCHSRLSGILLPSQRKILDKPE
jgi:hypothetical protein